jgi:hypothetical protein
MTVFSGLNPLEKDLSNSSPIELFPLFLNKEQKSEKVKLSFFPIGVKKS